MTSMVKRLSILAGAAAMAVVLAPSPASASNIVDTRGFANVCVEPFEDPICVLEHFS